MKAKKVAKNTDESKSREMVSVESTENTVTPEERLNMVAEAAYYCAEQRDFQGGDQDRDWFESEAEIDNLLAS